MTSWNGSSPHAPLKFLVDCLERISCLRDLGSRRLCLDLLADQYGVTVAVDEIPTARRHLFSIVLACRRQHPRALAAFIDVVEQLEPGSIPVRRARAAVEEMAARDLVAETALEIITEPERRELFTLLGGSAEDRLAECVRAAAGPAVELTSPRYYPIEAISTLERLNARPDGVPPLLVFVEHVAAYFGDRRAEQLRRWNDRQAARMGLTEKILAVRFEQAALPAPARDVVAYLVIRIEPDLLDPDVLMVVHWRQNDPAGWRPRRGEPFIGDLDTVRRHVAGLVAEAEEGWAQDAETIRIEFLLPFALINLPVDQWDLEIESDLPRPLGVHYQVALRSLDRARSPRWYREWRRRWEQFKNLPAGGALAVHWLFSEGAESRNLAALDARLAVRKDVVSLVLRSVPEAAGLGELVIGVRSGVPVIVWYRGESSRSEFDAEVRTMRDVLPELLEQLRRLRSQARQVPRPESHVGSSVSLLWDEPDRPVEPQEPPTAPSEEVSA